MIFCNNNNELSCELSHIWYKIYHYLMVNSKVYFVHQSVSAAWKWTEITLFNAKTKRFPCCFFSKWNFSSIKIAAGQIAKENQIIANEKGLKPNTEKPRKLHVHHVKLHMNIQQWIHTQPLCVKTWNWKKNWLQINFIHEPSKKKKTQNENYRYIRKHDECDVCVPSSL